MNGVDTVEQIFPKQSLLYLSGISLLVAEISRISTGITLLLPIRVTFRFCSTVNSLACSAMERFPISSIKRELPLAASNFPGRLSLRR